MNNSMPVNETLDWIRRVRDESYEAMKDMSPQERFEYRQSQREKLLQKVKFNTTEKITVPTEEPIIIETDLTEEEQMLIEESVKRYRTDPDSFVPLENRAESPTSLA
ncbi:MAG: hypothetical protein LBL62_04900 [Planctomycetaceae bacterium]|jgi:hypothetical protein|nr:hypothetical protein [Planctomycetaceae bacterium]